MSLTNTQNAYGWLSIILHWISAVGVIWIYLLGHNIVEVTEEGLPSEDIAQATQAHASIALCFFAFLVARIFAHFAQARPTPFPQANYLQILSIFVQRLWLLMIAVQLITGPLIIWTASEPLRFFDYFAIPSPTGRLDGPHELLEGIHIVSSFLFWPLLLLHFFGAMKHLVFDRDGTLQRMLWVKNTKPKNLG